MKRKVIYNRRKIPSEEIQKQQDFETILNRIKKKEIVYWKSIGFWGTIGASAVALFLLITLY